MFIHIGNGNVIRAAHIVAIIEAAVISSSTITNEMIANNQKKVIGSSEKSKSVVITEDKIYYSTLSVSTLKKRASMASVISNLDDYSEDLELG
ncbi:DUF370 domain-containing protein [Virgibacillus sp. 179-BFC.A HS]|uniref:DUF370 domain-containing protein n=1 Tax=Tigheibacillus jepli TaxID=3035914 RepID=A0ABU5CCW8_9BACI|nr:extracellular matrix/biofilm biosynthesis regulator RemA family protein [Virgibacillus sp. 179-BFC.A HS]MDY0404116.1 DUF370 domain-containing protein [Virgibacillus sp. 179-BFC.A HS]